MMTLGNKGNVNSNVTIIGLLSKSYTELKAINFTYFQQTCLYCLTFAVYLYSIYRPSMQTSDDKEHLALTLYQSCIEFSNLTVTNTSNLVDNHLDIIAMLRKMITSSIELSNNVNNLNTKKVLSMEINYIALAIMEKAAQNEKLLEFSITLFTWSLNNSENILKQVKADFSYSKDVNVMTVLVHTLRVLKANTELFIAYVYMELNHLERSLACVERTMQESKDLQDNVLTSGLEYLRLIINCKNKSIFAAEESVKKLIHATNAYSSAIKGILQFITIGDDVVSDQLFATIEQKFPKDPEYIQTRIMRLKFLLSCNYTLNKPSNESALQLCNSIVDDHLMHVHILDTEQQSVMFNVIKEKIQWSYKQQLFKEVLDWCKIALCVNDDAATLQGNHTSIHLFMSNSHEELNNYEEMLQNAEKATSICHSTKTMLVLFKALLLVRPAKDAVEAIVSFQLDTLNLDKVEVLHRYVLCIKIILNLTTKLTHAKRYYALTLLMQEWIKYCTANALWSRTENSFFRMNAALLQHIYNYKVNLALLERKHEDSSIMDTEQQHVDIFLQPPTDYDELNKGLKVPITAAESQEILNILRNIRQVIDGLIKQGTQLEVLGETKELGLIADICWNIATLKSKNPPEDRTMAQQVEECDTSVIDLFDFAAYFYATLPSIEDKMNQICALLLSTSRRINDLHDISSSGNSDRSCAIRYDKVFLNLNNIEHLLQVVRADDNINKHESLSTLNGTYIMLHFKAALLKGSPTSMLQYVTVEKQQQLLSLDAERLNECIQMVKDATNSYYEVIRVLINYAIQACTRDAAQENSLLGKLYIERIKLSESRESALSTVVEIDQQLNRADSDIFDDDDVDSIVCMTYNYGVSLAELNNYNMAAEFLRMCISIAAHSSEIMKKEKLQDIELTYNKITAFRNKLEDTNRHEHNQSTSVQVDTTSTKPLSMEFF